MAGSASEEAGDLAQATGADRPASLLGVWVLWGGGDGDSTRLTLSPVPFISYLLITYTPQPLWELLCINQAHKALRSVHSWGAQPDGVENRETVSHW